MKNLDKFLKTQKKIEEPLRIAEEMLKTQKPIEKALNNKLVKQLDKNEKLLKSKATQENINLSDENIEMLNELTIKNEQINIAPQIHIENLIINKKSDKK